MAAGESGGHRDAWQPWLERLEAAKERALEMGGPERVMFSSSFSKTLAPGLRVGYLIAPPDLVKTLTTRANQTYISPAHLPEAAVHQVCAQGLLDPRIKT